MWKISLPPAKRLGYLSGQLVETTNRIYRHKRMFVTFLSMVLLVTATVIVMLQRAAASTTQKEAVVSGSHTTTMSSQQSATQNQPAQPTDMQSSTPKQASIVTNESSAKTELKVNNQTIPVPENGTVHTTVPTDNGSSSVSINVDASSTGTAHSSSSSFVQVSSNSSQSQVTVQQSP